MKKSAAAIIVFFAIAGTLVAQNRVSEAVVGKPYPFLDSNSEFYISGSSGFLIVKPWAKTVILQKIGNDLTMQKATEYKQFPKDFEVRAVGTIGKKSYLFYSAPSGDKMSLFAAQLDLDKGELMEGGREIVTSSDDIKKETFSGREFQFLQSDDSSHFAVCYRIKSRKLDKSKSYEVNGLWVFDDQLNELWHNEVALPYTEKKCDVRGRGIDTQGNIHTAISIMKDDSGVEKKIDEDFPNYSLQLLTFTKGSSGAVATPFNLKDKFIKNISINGTSEKIICSGFYDSHQLNENPQGTFVFFVAGGVSSETRLQPFSLPVVNEGLGKIKQKLNESKAKKNKPLDIDNLKLVDVTIQTDGSILIQGEEQVAAVAPRAVPSPGTPGDFSSTMGSPARSENLLIIKILPDGNLAWTRKIIKSQLTPLNGASYQYWQGNDSDFNFLFIEGDELIQYNLDPNTGLGEKQILTRFKPLLKKPVSSHALFLNRIAITPDKNSVVVETKVSGDAGRFGEVKLYKDNVLVKVPVR